MMEEVERMIDYIVVQEIKKFRLVYWSLYEQNWMQHRLQVNATVFD